MPGFIVVIRSPGAVLRVLAAIALVAIVAIVLTGISLRVVAPLSDAVCGRTVVIDPGHGGTDPGAVGSGGLAEKDVVLDIAKQLEWFFNRVAVYTVMTRDADSDLAGDSPADGTARKRLDLEMRVKSANESKADLYISIHANSFPDKVWSGAQTFYHGGSPDSKLLAEAIQKELADRLGPNLRRARPGDHYYVLRNTKVPSVIVEVGFLSNPVEEELLGQPGYRKKLAEAIFHGTVKFLVERYKRERRAPREEMRRTSEDNVRRAVTAGRGEAVLYFAGPTNFDDTLMPELRNLPPEADRLPLAEQVRVVVEELIRGPGKGSILHRTIPPGVALRGVQVLDDTAYLDFSKELGTNHWGGSRTEELTVYSIVNTVCSLPGVEKVAILIEGKSGCTIGGHIVLDEPLKWNPSLIASRLGG